MKSISDGLLRYSIEAEIEALEWSGANSIYHRDLAAKALSGVISSQIAKSPATVRVVIAHSHGGNVALLAKKYMGKLSERERLFIVTMATPFLNYSELNMNRDVVSVVKLPFVLIILGFIGYFQHIYSMRIGILPWWILISCNTIIMILVFFIFFAMFDFFHTRLKKRASKILDAGSTWRYRSLQPEIHVIRDTDDEASLVLAASSLMNFLLKYSSILFSIVSWILMFLLLLWFFIISLNNEIEFWIISNVRNIYFGNYFDFMRYSIIAFFFLTFSAVGLLMIGAMARGLFGRELFIPTIGIEVGAQSVPDGQDGLSVITLGPKGRSKSMRHSIYEHNDCANMIIEAIVGSMKRKTVKPDAEI